MCNCFICDMELTIIKDENETNKSVATEDAASFVQESDSTSLIENSNRVMPTSILAILDDKNKAISVLKRQIQNQKLQLGFYLHKNLSSKKVDKLANSCTPEEAEENLQVHMAISKFYKESGLKSKIMDLHERMKNVEQRTLKLIDQQEAMVQRIVHKLAEISSNNCTRQGGIIQFILFNLKGNPAEVDFLAKIVGSTNKLRKELDTFRTCCNRLIVIEDERNTLVEQVYSTPASERMSYNIILASQYEKLRLEKEVSEIRQDQKTLQHRLANICQERTPTREGDHNDSEMHNMLNVVNAEALSLLNLTKTQREMYLDEIYKLRKHNDELCEQITILQNDIKYKEKLQDRTDALINEHEAFKNRSANKFNEMHINMQILIDENQELKNRLEKFSNIEEQVKFMCTKLEDMDTVQRQRDYYKSQVEDLQAIRAAYSQLVEQPARDEEYEIKIIEEQATKIKELEHYRNQAELDKRTLEEQIADQEFQIKHLLPIIEKLTHCSNTHKEVHPREGNPDLLMIIVKQREEKTTTDSVSYSCKKEVSSQTITDITVCSTLEDVQANPIRTTALTSVLVASASPKTFTEDKAIMCTLGSDESLINNNTCCNLPLIPYVPVLSTTSVQVQTINRNGKSESMKAVWESTAPVEGLIHLNNSAAITLRLNRGSNEENEKQTRSVTPSPNKQLATIISGQILKAGSSTELPSILMDEFELMKDSSTETVPTTLPSMHHQMEGMFKMPQHQSNSNVCGMQLSVTPSVGILHQMREDIKMEDSGESDFECAICKECKNDQICKPSRLSGRLKQIACYLDQALAEPGKEIILKSVRTTYNTTFTEDSTIITQKHDNC